MQRPPPIVVEDTFRHDIHSDDVRTVYPDLPATCPKERKRYLECCDDRAYNVIRATYPRVLPPHRREEEVAPPTRGKWWLRWPVRRRR